MSAGHAPYTREDATQTRAPGSRANRGKLRIYFGAAAGVGKTYAMLVEARQLQANGRQVLVGVVDAHGRREIAALLNGLEVLPQRMDVNPGKGVIGFDLDRALTHRAALILVDELARSNAHDARHPKRWQDVEELLNAGIDVFTTVNVQDLESLNDVVGGITGLQVDETVPDTVFDDADEVVLVDVPVDELLARVKAGKIYPAAPASDGLSNATRDFCSKGNLIALRELALRRTADRIEDDVQAYRVEQAVKPIWKTDATLLACIGPHVGAEHIVRGAARLAGQLNAEWHAIYIETPRLQRLPSERREQILQTLKLAEKLGATTAVLADSDIALAIVGYARSRNFSKIVLGHGHFSWVDYLPWHKEYQKRIAAYAPDIDLIEIGCSPAASGSAVAEANGFNDLFGATGDDGPRANAGPSHASRRRRYGLAAAASLATALLTIPLSPYLELANIAMLFLLTVVLVSVRFGGEASVVATLVGVGALFLATPHFSFAVSDLQYTVTFLVMLAVGLITGRLTANLRYQAGVASHRESRSRALYEFARALSGALQTEQIFEITRSFIQRTFHAQATLLLPDVAGRLNYPVAARDDSGKPLNMSVLDLGIAQWAFDRAVPAGTGTDTLPGTNFFYLPLVAPMHTRGVLAIQPENRRWVLIPEQRKQLDTFAALAAIALERVHYVEVAQEVLVKMESERLRNSLLAALSHDLRTPLTSLVGLSESLAMSKPALAKSQLELADALRDEAVRMSNLVSNLLDMARIQSGLVKLKREWLPCEEVVGSALRASRVPLAGHTVHTQLARDLPLVCFDAVLIERVLCNLLENAVKYTPAGSHIVLAAECDGPFLQLTVSDNGPGIRAGQEEIIFEKFTRGERESAKPGVGLGLSICRAIVEAHGGAIRAQASDEGGAAFVFTLPLGSPPDLPFMDENDHHE